MVDAGRRPDIGPVDAYRSARTPAEYYAARIRLLQDALPGEVVALADSPTRGRRRLPPPERHWLEQLVAEVLLPGPPVEVRSRTIADGVRSLVPAGDDGSTGLVVLFAASGGRLNVPLASLLQHLPWEGREVLLLTDPSRHAYLHGIPGVADSLPALAAWVRDQAAGRRVSTLGASMGGGPAVIVGILCGADRAAAAGGADPLIRPDGDGRTAAVRTALAARRSETDRSTTTVLCAHSERNEEDARRAEELLARVGTGRRVVVTPGRRHKVLREAQEGGVLEDLLRVLIGVGSVPAGDAADPSVLRVVGSPSGATDARPSPSLGVPMLAPMRPRPPRRRRDRIIARTVRLLPATGPWRRAAVAAAYRIGVVVGVGRPGREPVRRRPAP